jgi:EAL domain-containing protein (putative c-di-GMP-specific phosphodiesterase class I)/glycosyltransferase involved in cell wall biosynthesis
MANSSQLNPTATLGNWPAAPAQAVSSSGSSVSNPSAIDITVAIPTYNGAERLPLVLDQLRKQTQVEHLKWEIIICDNGSLDDTKAVVERYQADWPTHCPLIYRFAAEQGAAFARQRAAETAQGQLIAFLDDDNIPAADWLFQAHRFAQAHPQVGAFGSQIHGQFERELPAELKNIQCFLAIIERGDQPHRYEPANKILPPAAGLVVRTQAWLEAVPKRLFLNNKGKSAGLASEDLEAILYIQKAGWEVWYNPDMVVHHVIPDGRLRKDYLITLLRCVGLSRFHIRLLGTERWQHPFAVPAYIANDIRKLALHRLRYGRQSQLSTVESCDRELLISSVISPFFLLKKAAQDSVQAVQNRRNADSQQWLAKITQALEEDSFVLYQQPVVAVESSSDGLFSDSATHLSTEPSRQKELLLRLQAPGEPILPGRFLPTAKRYGILQTIDRWVIRYLFNRVKQQQIGLTQSLSAAPMYAVNLSFESATNESLAAFIASQLDHLGLPASLFCFEIPAAAALTSPDFTSRLILALRQLGCHITLDDAAPSPSTADLIARLPLSYVKLSPAAVKALTVSNAGRSASLWQQLQGVMQQAGVQAIAKGIDSPALLEVAQQQGIRYVQGYQLERPQPF